VTGLTDSGLIYELIDKLREGMLLIMNFNGPACFNRVPEIKIYCTDSKQK
jgi:hypothetical protein